MVIRNLHPVLPEFIDLAEWFRRMDVPLDVEFFAPGELPEDAEIVYRRLEGGGSR